MHRMWLVPLLLVPTLWTCSDAQADYPRPEKGQVRIVRDQYGVPHIMASDDYSLFYGAGYAQAEDQLENVVKNYRRAAGRAAEFEGPGELMMDHLIRALGVPERGDQYYAELPAEAKSHLDGYAAGINAYIRKHRDRMPDWIDEVRPQDVLRFSTYVDVLFSVSDCRNDLTRAGVKLAGLDRLSIQREQTYGSNQFAISPKLSSTGTAQLSMDPHLPLSGFYRWYEMHLVGPEINVMGACFFGTPYVSMGRSANTAWCMTVNGPDLGDVFAFDIHPDDPTQYRDVDGWRKFAQRQETYKVLTGGELKEQTLPVRTTELGPVIAADDGKAYVFALPWSDSSNRVRQFYDMATAKTVAQFKDALRPLGLVMFNIVYADTAGDIFYISNGRIPRRDERIDSREIRPGHESWARWQGYHPLDELPQVLNPPCGFVMNCNSGPQNVCLDVAPQPSDFPSYVMSQEANSRSRRLHTLLANDQEITPDELHAYATDTRLEAADRWLEPLVAQLEKYAKSDDASSDEREQIAEISKVLNAWDRRADLESRGGALFTFIMFGDGMTKKLDSEQPADVAKPALARAAEFRKLHKALDVPWKEFSRIRRGTIDSPVAGFGARTAPLSSFVALRPSYGALLGPRHYCLGGSSYGMLVNFADGVSAVSCLPFGVSDNPESEHYADQLPLYADTKFKPAWFKADEIMAHAKSDVLIETASEN